jgi:hypothetical protein
VSQVRILPGALGFPQFIDRCYGAAMETFGYVVGFGTPILVVVVIFVAMRAAQKRSRFEGPAITGTANVVTVRGTSAETGAKVICEFGLLVDVPGHAPYNVSLHWPVHPVDIPRVQPGATLPVQVDSENLQKVRILL